MCADHGDDHGDDEESGPSGGGGIGEGTDRDRAENQLRGQLNDRAEVARRLAKLVVHWSARGRQQQLEVAAAAAAADDSGQMFPDQGAFGLRRQHAFSQRREL